MIFLFSLLERSEVLPYLPVLWNAPGLIKQTPLGSQGQDAFPWEIDVDTLGFARSGCLPMGNWCLIVCPCTQVFNHPLLLVGDLLKALDVFSFSQFAVLTTSVKAWMITTKSWTAANLELCDSWCKLFGKSPSASLIPHLHHFVYPNVGRSDSGSSPLGSSQIRQLLPLGSSLIHSTLD